jgi:hypothetical protein
MHEVLLEANKSTFSLANFIVINAYEMTTIDNIQWLSIHLYNICGLMVKVLLKFGWLGLKKLRRKLMNMGYNGSNVFQGH